MLNEETILKDMEKKFHSYKKIMKNLSAEMAVSISYIANESLKEENKIARPLVIIIMELLSNKERMEKEIEDLRISHENLMNLFADEMDYLQKKKQKL